MRDFVAHLAQKELSPKTISEVSNAVKQIISSVLDSNGDEVFPRKWNAEFIDSPIVSDQHCPIVSKDQIEKALANASETDATLYLLLAASGLRIGQALAIRIGHSDTSSCLVDGAVIVRTSIWRGQEGSPKTPSANRTVKIAKPIADRLQEFAGKRTGFLFGNGMPAKQTTLRSHFVEARGLPGFHAFRRFRTTWLRKNRVQEDLIRFWLGHAEGSVTDGYSKLADDVEYRRKVADETGIGFSL